MHLLSSRVSFFLRAFILFRVQKDLPIPLFDKDFFKRLFSCLATKSKVGRPPSEFTKLKDKDLIDFYNSEFSPLLPPNSDISALYLSHVISNFAATKMCTNLEKSIQDHFFHYLFRFVNQYLSFLF
jgi:hypothetical protein